MVTIILTYCYTIVTIGLLYFFLKKSLVSKFSLRNSILWWLLFGCIFNLYSFTWLYTAYPLIWLPEGLTQLVGIFIVHLILALVASLGFSVVGWFMLLKSNQVWKPFLFATSLTLAEMIRSFLLSLLYKDENSTLGFHYTSSTLGNALSTTPFIEFAYFGGVFSLTFVLGYFVYSCMSKNHIALYFKHVLVFIGLLLVTHFYIPTYGPLYPVKVGIITTNFKTVPDSELAQAFKVQGKTLHAMTLSLRDSKPSIIVYPEDARYIEHISEEQRQMLSKRFPKTLFIDGSTNTFRGKLVNVSLFYFAETKKILARGKSFLLPFNEFIPIFFRPIFSLFIPQEDMEVYVKNHTYTPINSQKTISFNGIQIATLLCSEIFSHKVIESVRKENPSLVFFQSHLNVFHDNPLVMAMIYSSTQVAAAQLRRPLISSTNGAPSLIVSPHGKINAIIPTGFSTFTYMFSK